MHRSILWLLFAVLPIAACNAEQSSAPTNPAQSPPTRVAANDHAGHDHAAAPSAATAAPGERYTVLPRPQPTQTPGKIEVVEIFLYTCPHCYSFEPAVNAWKAKLPEDVAFVRMPATFGANGLLLARTYYAAEVFGVLDKMHSIIFEAIHQQRRSLNNEEAVLKLFAENGIDPGAFRAAMNSFAVDSKLRRAQQLEVGYGVTGVPALTVNGKYGISIARLGGEGMLRVADELIAKERKAAQ